MDETHAKMNWRLTLNSHIDDHGLPTSIGTRGWIVERKWWYLNEEFLGVSESEMKGPIYVPRCNGHIENYSDKSAVGLLMEDICFNNVIGTRLGKQTDSNGDVINLMEGDVQSKGWEWCGLGSRNREDLVGLARRKMARSYSSDLLNDEDLVLSVFTVDYCECKRMECNYDLPYEFVSAGWKNGDFIDFELNKDQEIVLM
jgi:hypothetical protein